MSPENPSGEASLAYIGAKIGPDGQLDLSQAATVQRPESGPTLAEKDHERARTEVDQDRPPQPTAESRLDAALNNARAYRLEEADLRRLIQGLNMDDKPAQQLVRLRHQIRQRELDLKPDQLLDLARQYQKERIRATEKGPLLHYHQTSLANFDGIVDQGALLSHQAQRELGIAGRSSGSRPDAVQFTRDHYDQNGQLLQPGLNNDRVGVAGDVTFVFNDSIMDAPHYDGIVHYPNVPFAPLNELKAVLVAKEENIPHVADHLAEKGLIPEIVSRREWLERQTA